MAVWHLPLVAAGRVPPVILAAIVASQIMYTWLARHARESVLVVMLAHAAQGGLGGEYFGAMFSGPDAVLETRLLVAVQVAVALAIALLSGWSRPRASAAGAAGEAPLDPGATAPATRRRP